MNRIFLMTVLAVGLANNMFGQGLFLSNIGNTGSSVATSGGLVYIPSGVIQLADLYNNDVGVEISYGFASDSLSPLGLGTYTAATDPKGYTAWDIGQFYLGNVSERTVIPGAEPGESVWIELKMWLDGPYGTPVGWNSYADAYPVTYTATVLWLQPLDGGGPVLAPPVGFTMMPSIIFSIPEPSTFMLTHLGIGAIWLLRRHK